MWFGVLLAFALLAGCRPAEPPSSPVAPPLDPVGFDGERAFEEARLLVGLGARDAGTPGAEVAARHIAARLGAVGVDAVVDSFEENTSLGKTTFHNVIGRVPGVGDGIVVIGSHFDTKSGMPKGFEGANDSASSTGALIELARVLTVQAEGNSPLPFEVRLVFFDGEECRVAYGPRDGLHGSRHYARKLVLAGETARVQAVLVLDMVGDCDLTLTLPRNGDPRLMALVLDSARDEGMRPAISLSRYEIGDDHVPFLEAGMPAVNIIDFAFGSAPGLNDYWHTAEDTMDKICPESLSRVGRLTLRMLERLRATAN
jgi:glutaminyl-peptide cyclotransferase